MRLHAIASNKDPQQIVILFMMGAIAEKEQGCFQTAGSMFTASSVLTRCVMVNKVVQAGLSRAHFRVRTACQGKKRVLRKGLAKSVLNEHVPLLERCELFASLFVAFWSPGACRLTWITCNRTRVALRGTSSGTAHCGVHLVWRALVKRAHP